MNDEEQVIRRNLNTFLDNIPESWGKESEAPFMVQKLTQSHALNKQSIKTNGIL